MEEEIWVDIKGFEGLYQVSNFGKIKSLSRYVCKKDGKKMFVDEKILQPYCKSNSGYLSIPLSKDGKRCVKTIHRIVAESFIPNINEYRDVNHKDGNKNNNNVDNLEWCTHSYNIKHAYEKLKHKHVYRMVKCLETGVVYKNAKEASKDLGFSESGIKANARGTNHSVHGYHFINLDRCLL